MENASLSFNEALESYIKTVQAICDSYFEKNYPNSTVVKSPKIVAEIGKKYVRIVKDEGMSSRSVHTFINSENGDILKAAGWKAPAPNGKRGNLYDVDYPKCINWHGAEYIKKGF